jgi:tetratricopeptide (TPR) repeat protein
VFCPSCAAHVPLPEIPVDDRSSTVTERLHCPVCGTEFALNVAGTTEQAVVESDRPSATQAPRRVSTEEALLKRLSEEPPAHTPVGWVTSGIIFAAVLAISFGIFRLASKPDSYAPSHEPDSAMLLQKRLLYQPAIDSLNAILRANPNDTGAHLTLADDAYDAGYWAESVSEFQTYLRMKPRDADARVDYAYAIAQASGDLHRALGQIDSALTFNPNHLNALINAGILTTQTISDSNHAETLARAKGYFQRAKDIASKNDPAMASRIDTLLMEIDKTGERMAK